MELRHLRYFVAVAEELHFGRAASRAHIAQPSLSQQIRALESELQVQLLVRTTRSVRLTDAGQAFLSEARRSLQHAERAVVAAQRASRGETGQVVVGFVGSAAHSVLPPLLRSFRRRFPDVALVLQQLTTAEQVSALADERIDLGILRPPVDDAAIRTLSLLKEPLLLAIPASHALSTRNVIDLSDMSQEPFVLPPRALGPGMYDQIVSLCHHAGFSPQIAQVAAEMHTITGLVAANLGVSVVPASAHGARHSGIVYKRLVGGPTSEVAMAWRDDRLPPIARQMRAVARALRSEIEKATIFIEGRRASNPE